MVEDSLNNNIKFNQRGDKNNNWKGGRKKSTEGYWCLWMPEYFSSEKSGYVKEHIYFYQECHKLCMLSWGHVHHIEPVTKDYCNNMPWNLQGMMNYQHVKLHNLKDMAERICIDCGKNNDNILKRKDNNRPFWYGNKRDGFICQPCYWRRRRNIIKSHHHQ